jgi:hypothetical protein
MVTIMEMRNVSRLAEWGVVAEQIEQDKLLREQEIQTAHRAVLSHAKKNSWSPEDTDTVLQVLGIIESPPPLKQVSRR